MDWGELAASLRRRWRTCVAVVLGALVATAATVMVVGPSYETEGSVLLFPPTDTLVTDGESATQGNPFLNLGGLTTARDVLIRAINAQSVRDDVDEDYPGADYEAWPDPTSSGPVVIVSVTGTSEDQATAALHALLDRVLDSLDGLQRTLDIPGESRITSRELSVDERPVRVYKWQIRAGIVTSVLIIGLGLLTVGLLDGLLIGRRRRAEGEGPTTGPEQTGANQPTAPADAPADTPTDLAVQARDDDGFPVFVVPWPSLPGDDEGGDKESGDEESGDDESGDYESGARREERLGALPRSRP